MFYLDWNRVLLEKRKDEESAMVENGDSSRFFQGSLVSFNGTWLSWERNESRYERNSLLLIDVSGKNGRLSRFDGYGEGGI